MGLMDQGAEAARGSGRTVELVDAHVMTGSADGGRYVSVQGRDAATGERTHSRMPFHPQHHDRVSELAAEVLATGRAKLSVRPGSSGSDLEIDGASSGMVDLRARDVAARHVGKTLSRAAEAILLDRRENVHPQEAWNRTRQLRDPLFARIDAASRAAPSELSSVTVSVERVEDRPPMEGSLGALVVEGRDASGSPVLAAIPYVATHGDSAAVAKDRMERSGSATFLGLVDRASGRSDGRDLVAAVEVEAGGGRMGREAARESIGKRFLRTMSIQHGTATERSQEASAVAWARRRDALMGR